MKQPCSGGYSWPNKPYPMLGDAQYAPGIFVEDVARPSDAAFMLMHLKMAFEQIARQQTDALLRMNLAAAITLAAGLRETARAEGFTGGFTARISLKGCEE